MEELGKKEKRNVREEIFSRTVRAGKRTYFFDVKTTKSDERYLTITESKRKFNNDQGKFFYEKHKLFLYNEDFENFTNGLNAAIEFIHTGTAPADPCIESDGHGEVSLTDIDFENLGSLSGGEQHESEFQPKE